MPAPIDILREVVDAAVGRAEIILAGGVRRGVHVLEALVGCRNLRELERSVVREVTAWGT